MLLLSPDGRRLLHGAAPSLPEAYCDAINGIAIGPNVGSCGTVAYLGHAIFVTDIETDPLWQDFRELALSHGLRACWSTPIRDAADRLIGTFAVYYREPRAPTGESARPLSNIAARRYHRAGALARGLLREDLQRPSHFPGCARPQTLIRATPDRARLGSAACR